MSTNFTYESVLLDIEGTTTPISFVHEKLFPYVKNNVEKFLNELWEDKELQDNIQLLRDQAIKDVNEKIFPEANLIPMDTSNNKDEVKNSIIQNISWQMKLDRKIGALKSFQGYMWKYGFDSGELKGMIYQDVLDVFKKWVDLGIKIYIYSSGSVAAQKLIFQNSDKGDLLEYISGYFDTTIGLKLEKQSYENIAKQLKLEPNKILFLKITAAKLAGFQAAIIDRPNNPPLSENDKNIHLLFTDFHQVLSHSSFIKD
ncbi:10365_t:CDS:2 [Diversispora eburnea]|uniref:10365_t:CDS:1 n=1 Tax=Diversispora eburnea TaxID=1213867 RepID=A0A9N8VYJ7_9GLOM|nr:10365_t:CDS:2 [Diversispora eburnea]